MKGTGRGDLKPPLLEEPSAGMDAGRDAMPCIVDTRGNPVSTVRLNRRAAAVERGQKDDRAQGE